MEEEAIGKAYDTRLMARLLRYLRPYRKWVLASVCLLTVHSLLGVSGPYLTKVAIDRYLNPESGAPSPLDAWLPEEPLPGLNALALIYLAVLAVGFGFRYLQTYVMNYTGQRVMYDLRREIFAHLQKMGIRFYDRTAVGRLVTRVTTDVDVLNEMFTSGVVAIAGDLLTLAFILAVMIHLSPMLTAVLFSVLPLVLLVTILFRVKARQSYRQVRVAVAKINSFLQEHISGMPVVQLFNHEQRSWLRFDQINAEHRDAQRRAIRAHALFFPTIEWLGVLGMAVLFVFGGYGVQNGTVTLGVVVAFLQYGTRIFRPLQDLSEKYNILQAAMASSERIFKLLDTPCDEDWEALERPESGAGDGVEKERRPAAASPDLAIEFRNVWFAYKDEDWVLRDVSFAIQPGETLAIVGHTGAGKTTLISLLLRFYDIQQGMILAGGRDIREWPLQALRRQFGVVLQDPYLFTGTIADNIRLSSRDISGDELEQVAREVNLDGFIRSLPRGYEQPLRERGTSLSWGQKQLVSFARALLHRPRILILDEATSSVDTETEFKIREAVPRLMSGHTSIVIAHRLSTIKKADRILVMHKGQVREIGPHQQLMDQRGVYWKLYQLQYREQEVNGSQAPRPPGSDIGRDGRPPAPEQTSFTFSRPSGGDDYTDGNGPAPESDSSDAEESSSSATRIPPSGRPPDR